MGKKPKLGTCKLCGKYTALTFEHVPPKSAFNALPVRQIRGDEALKSLSEQRKPWDLSNLFGKIQQRGNGGYYLCSDCNANTGAWYVPHFERFTQGVYGTLISTKGVFDNAAAIIKTGSIRPLPILKEIMVMFCDINHNCLGDQRLRSFLMNRENADLFDSKKYRVYCYIAKGPIHRMNGVSAACIGALSGAPTILMISEISSFPLGFALYVDLPDSYTPKGCDITSLANFKYDEEVSIRMVLPILESNNIFSGDYRTKEELRG